ncbi:unnamed protein product [Cylicostephanus goldi]|uniref:Uncharacterized protein n=1 Tax=Cylicostephanus goldi TaxID=71465 RepID=A0A3P6T4B6_CYLGO|nr:unnamed protein product [Cylicostephanus goldi]
MSPFQELPRSGTVKCFFCDVGVFGAYPVVDLRLLPDPGHPIMSHGALAKRVNLALPDHAVGDMSDEILRSVLFEKDAVGNLIPVRMQVCFRVWFSCIELIITYRFSVTSFTEVTVDGETLTTADLWLTDGRAVVEVVLMNMPDGRDWSASTK